MHIEIDPRSIRPLADQIAAGIRQTLARKDLVEGDSLPSVVDMVRQLRVNPSAVRQALSQLEKEGLIAAGQPGDYRVTVLPPEARQSPKGDEEPKLP